MIMVMIMITNILRIRAARRSSIIIMIIIIIIIIIVIIVTLTTSILSCPQVMSGVLARGPPEPVRPPAIYILQKGVQWKQGVVVYMTLYTSLLYNTTPIHYTPLPLHPPLPNVQASTSAEEKSNTPRRPLGSATSVKRSLGQNENPPAPNLRTFARFT